jgi:hypothetical protein
MKRIIVCAAGTWNVRDQRDKLNGKRRPTNVTKTARAILAQATDRTPKWSTMLTGGRFGHGRQFSGYFRDECKGASALPRTASGRRGIDATGRRSRAGGPS